MLRTISTNISVITNFGCRADCWYCIWKGHRLKNVNEPTNWDKLEDFLFQHKDKGKVSVSGGGDCLYQYDRYVGWWIKFFEIAERLNMLVDVHTREKFTHQSFWRKHINKCVFSSDKLNNEEIEYLKYLSKLTKVRITHLVTEYTTDRIIEGFIELQNEISCQFTIKQLTGYSDKGRYQAIRNKYPEIYYLDEGDYNMYYMPDNKVRNNFQ